MSIANGLALPNPLSNGTTADAVQVMGDFNYLLAVANRALLDAGGGAGMNAQSTQIHNLANGTSANDAVNLSQISGLAPLASPTFTGTLMAATISASASLNVGGNVNAVGNFVSSGGGFSGGAASFTTIAGTTLSATGLATLNGGIMSNGALSLTGALATGNAANSVGYLGAPSRTATANTSVGLADLGGTINMNGLNLTLNIQANGTLAIPVDNFVLVRNLNATPVTITITTDTLTWSGTNTSGSRTVGQNGEVRLAKVGSTLWFISGTALS